MKSTNNNQIEFKKHTNLGKLPLFVSIIHRHLEKEKTGPSPADVVCGTYNVPVDLLSLSIADDDLLTGIAAIDFHYQKR